MNPLGVFHRRTRRGVPVVRQYAVTDCGPCCLLAVVRFWGGRSNVARVRDAVGTDVHGSSLYQLAAAAERLGFQARGATGEYDDLATVQLPAIAHIVLADGLLHYVVVERVWPDRIRIMDPATGRRTLARLEFEEIWQSRAALLLEPTETLASHSSEPWWRWIARHLRDEEALLTQSVFLGLIYTGLGLLTSLFIKVLLDEFIPGRDARVLWMAGTVLLVLLLGRAVIGYGRQRMVALLQRRVGTTLNRDFVTGLFELPLSFFERIRKGDVTARLQDNLRVQTGGLQIVSGVIIDGMVVVGAILGLVVIAPPLTWIALAVLPLYGTLLFWSARELHARQNTALRAFTDAEAQYIDSLQGIREILGTGTGRSFAERNHASWATFLGALEKFAIRQASLGGAAEALGSTALVAALVYGASLVLAGRMQLGAMVGGYTLIALILPAIARLADLFVVAQVTRVSGARVLDVLDSPRQSEAATEPFAMDRTLSLEDVTFTWSRGTVLFNGVDLTLRRGCIVGLTGANGAGKTTLVKLLRREYEPTSGRVLVDGLDARRLDLAGHRAAVALLPSEVAIFAGSLYEDIALHREGITPEDVARTITEAGLAPFMERFPAGLVTPIGEEGRQLSVGERYTVALLRALVGQPQVLIVDEAFAMLDSTLLRYMLDALQRFASDHAILMISHDPAVLRHADQVLALQDGRVVDAHPMELDLSRTAVVNEAATPD